MAPFFPLTIIPASYTATVFFHPLHTGLLTTRGCWFPCSPSDNHLFVSWVQPLDHVDDFCDMPNSRRVILFLFLTTDGEVSSHSEPKVRLELPSTEGKSICSCLFSVNIPFIPGVRFRVINWPVSPFLIIFIFQVKLFTFCLSPNSSGPLLHFQSQVVLRLPSRASGCPVCTATTAHGCVVDSSVSSCVLLMSHPQPSHRGGHTCTVDALPGPTGGDVTSRTRQFTKRTQRPTHDQLQLCCKPS